jgi:hypothetical protein
MFTFVHQIPKINESSNFLFLLAIFILFWKGFFKKKRNPTNVYFLLSLFATIHDVEKKTDVASYRTGSSMLSLNANRTKARFWTGIKMLTSVINLNTIELKSK